MDGVDLVNQQPDCLDVLRKSYKWYKKLFLRLVMQCALSAHKLYKKEGGKDDFLFFLLLLQNAPWLERDLSRVAIDNISRLTGMNRCLSNDKSPEEWKAHEIKTWKNSEFVWQRKDSQGVQTNKNNGFARDAQGNLDFVWKKMLITVPDPIWLQCLSLKAGCKTLCISFWCA